MSIIVKQDSNGVKPLLQVGELGYDNFPTGGDAGRVYVGTGTSNIAQAKKSEVMDVDSKVDTHVAREDNPHGVTKAQVGLGNVDNTADIDKNVLSATKLTTAININGIGFDGTADLVISDDTKIPVTDKGIANGVASLDSNGQVPAEQLPSYVDDVVEVATKVELPVIGESGKIYVVVNDEDNNNKTTTYRWASTVYVLIDDILDADDIKTLYESNPDTNVFTDSEKARVDISTGLATTAQTLPGAVNELDGRLADKVNTATLENLNIFRADKVLASKDVVNLIYSGGNLVKIRYTSDTDVDYEVLSYVGEDLTNVAHHIGGVLQGNTVLTYSGGDLVSSIFIGV